MYVQSLHIIVLLDMRERISQQLLDFCIMNLSHTHSRSSIGLPTNERQLQTIERE